MVKKIFVVRTHSLVSKENCGTLFSFGSDNQVVIPLGVIDELENLKHQYNQKARNAKAILDYLASFDIHKLMSKSGVIQKNGSTLRLINSFKDEQIKMENLTQFDKRCLQIAKGLSNENNGKIPVILVSKNAALRIKANSIGIETQDFKDDLYPALSEQYTGRIECTASKNTINKLYTGGKIGVSQITEYKSVEWFPNMFLHIKAFDDDSQSTIARFDGNIIVPLQFANHTPYNISPKNAGQVMLQEALLQDYNSAPLIIVKGGAGCGKTIMSLACALDKIEDKQSNYKEILYSRPTDTVGQENIGFLPGGVEEKYMPHLKAITDNLKKLLEFQNQNSNKPSKKSVNSLLDKYIEIQPLGFLRGRTIVDSYYIIDETQNIDPGDIKSIVSRSGERSKFIFLGDPTQIDNPDLNERYNGLVYLSEKTKDWQNAWQITLTDDESVRSDLAKMAAKLL